VALTGSCGAMRTNIIDTWARPGRYWAGSVLLAALAAILVPTSAAAQAEVVEYYATDAVGSTRVVFNAAGQVVAQSDYLPFGEALGATGSLPAQRFTGQQRDGEAGLDNFNARALDWSTWAVHAAGPGRGRPVKPADVEPLRVRREQPTQVH
jgi:hypothetical protein